MDYCAFPKEKRKGGELRKEERGNGKEGVWKARVVQRSRRGHLAVLGRGRATILFSPRGNLWPPPACSSPLQVQALSAGSLHTDKHYKLIFHTLQARGGGGTPYEERRSFSHLQPPLLFFFFVPLSGLKIWAGLLGWGSVVIISVLLFFFLLSEIFSCQESGWLSLNGWKNPDLTWCNNQTSVNQRDVMYNYYSVW